MKKPALSALVAMVIYSFANVTIEEKLSKYSTAGILLYWYIVMLSLTLVVLGFSRAINQPINFPTGPAVLAACLVGVAYFCADFCFISAYTSGGSAFSVTTIMILLPGLVAGLKALRSGEKPNTYQVVAYGLIVVATLLLVKYSPAEQVGS